MYEEELRSIRQQLRLQMNGVVAASMRKHGVEYRMNFGVSLPVLKEVAGKYEKDAGLAETLWKQEVRELKILATLIYPPGQFTPEKADEWAHDVAYQEIAEQYCANLLENVSFAPALVLRWIGVSEEQVAAIGYTLTTRLFMKGTALAEKEEPTFLAAARLVLDQGQSRVQRAALLALKWLGRLSESQAKMVLATFSDYADSADPVKREFFTDLQFEFEYFYS